MNKKFLIKQFLDLSKNISEEAKKAFEGFMEIYHPTLKEKRLTVESWTKLYDEWLYGDDLYE